MVQNENDPATKKELTGVITRLDRVESDITILKQDINTLKQDVGTLKQDVGVMKGDISSLHSISHNNTVSILRLQNDMNDVKERMATKDDVNRIISSIDAFAAEAQAYRQKDTHRGRLITEHDELLKNHEHRLSTLETK